MLLQALVERHDGYENPSLNQQNIYHSVHTHILKRTHTFGLTKIEKNKKVGGDR